MLQLQRLLSHRSFALSRSKSALGSLLVTATTMPILELGYKRIHYTDYEPQGQVRGTVLFTHGLGSTQNYYTPIIPVLLQDNFRCITYDKTGAGRSPYTFVQQTIETLARDAMGILQILHVSKAIVVVCPCADFMSMHLTHPRVIRWAPLKLRSSRRITQHAS